LTKGIVVDEGRTFRSPVPLAAQAHTAFLLAAAAGWAKDDDSGIVRLWGALNGDSVVLPSTVNGSQTNGVDQPAPNKTARILQHAEEHGC
jgi:hypothetical protein